MNTMSDKRSHKTQTKIGNRFLKTAASLVLNRMNRMSSSPVQVTRDQRRFATSETPGGFPMPALPKDTSSIGSVPDCQETDVDEYVRDIIQGKVDNDDVDWKIAIYDDSKVHQWMDREEKKARESPGKYDQYYRRDGKGTVRYAVEECRWRHEHQCNSSSGSIAALHKNGFVLVKDGSISNALRESFMNDVHRLANEDKLAKKSTIAPHPRYSTTVSQLVHPSMYVYEKGVTHVLSDVGADATSMPNFESFLGVQGVVNTDRPSYSQNDRMETNRYGRRRYRTDNDAPTAAECSNFQWLPSEFYVSTSTRQGTEPSPVAAVRSSSSSSSIKPNCHINSYINNLHPAQYKGLYETIGELFVEALPMLEEVLTQANDNGTVRKQLPRFTTPRGYPRIRRPSIIPYGNYEEQVAALDKKYKGKKVVPEPAIPSFAPPKYTVQNPTKVTLHDRPLQVIVKIIQWGLTPREKEYEDMSREDFQNPSFYFEGGHWHVEGTQDERIVASACCYLDAANITDTKLQFRDGSVDSAGCKLGGVRTNSGRIVAWPNYLHHKTGSFGLKNDKQPGSRTLCCFHLVDPTLRIRSTATVPPQQSSWIRSMADEVTTLSLETKKNEDLSLARSKISSYMKDLHVQSKAAITYEGAIERRKRFQEERSRDSDVIADNFWIPCD